MPSRARVILSLWLMLALLLPRPAAAACPWKKLGGRKGGAAALVLAAGGVLTVSAAEFIRYFLTPYSTAGALNDEEEEKLRKMLESGGRIELKDIEEANRLAAYLKIEQDWSFRKLPRARRLELLNKVFTELAKAPRPVRELLAHDGHHITLVTGDVRKHPEFHDRKEYKRTPGVQSGRLRVLAVDEVKPTTTLHETGHSYDYAFDFGHRRYTALTHPQRYPLSSTPEFQEVFQKTAWNDDHYGKNTREAFAQSFAMYYHSPQTRAKMLKDWPLAHEFIRRHFEEDNYPPR